MEISPIEDKKEIEPRLDKEMDGEEMEGQREQIEGQQPPEEQIDEEGK